MTDREIRIAIAEKCGWRAIRVEGGTLLEGAFKGMLCGQFGVKDYEQAIPDYPNDLDAMHSAWDSLSQEQKLSFHKHLKQIVLRDLTILTFEPVSDELLEAYTANATAHQRAEAFLRTLDLWRET